MEQSCHWFSLGWFAISWGMFFFGYFLAAIFAAAGRASQREREEETEAFFKAWLEEDLRRQEQQERLNAINPKTTKGA